MASIPKKPRKKMLDIKPQAEAAKVEQPIKLEVKPPEPTKQPEKINPIEMIQPDTVKKIEPMDLIKRFEIKKTGDAKLEKEVEQFEKKEAFNFKHEEEQKEGKGVKFKKWKKIVYVLLAAVLILAAGGFYLINSFLAKAEIKITTKKSEWNYVDSVLAGKNITKIGAAQKQIPAEVFSVKKNFNLSFPASTRKSVQDKATGKITIYNNFSSSPQVLLATTRFTAPDGKIFRLVEKTTVPGNSSIEAEVIADKPGPDYNIGPVSRFTIPGFQGSARYEKFYGVSVDPMTGGFIGERPYPTDDDIKQAKQKAETDFKNMVESALTLQLPPEFKIIDGARQFSIIKEQVNTSVDEKGNFSVFLEGQSSAIGFKESDLKSLMENLGQTDLGETFKIKNYNSEFGAGRADFDKGQVSYALTFKGSFEEPVDINVFEQQILGKNADELKATISSFPNIDKTTISFRPFWVKRVPKDLDRVKIEVE